MSRLRRDNCYSRCKDSVPRNGYSMHLFPTSDEDTSSARRSRLSSPLLNVSRYSMSPLERCCSCHDHYNRRKSSKTRAISNDIQTEARRMRENLKLQLAGSQVEEALAGDKQTALVQQLELTTNALEALIQHVRSLQVSHVTAQRVVQLAQQLIFPITMNYATSLPDDLVTLLRQSQNEKEKRLHVLQDVLDNCSRNIVASKQLQATMDKHNGNKEDFATAARNFQYFLEETQLTTSQMKKLLWQYEEITNDYRQNRKVLDLEIPKLVKIRLETIRQSFSTIAAFYEDREYFKHTTDLFKIFEETLARDETAVENRAYEKLRSQEICKNCKTNRVENK